MAEIEKRAEIKGALVLNDVEKVRLQATMEQFVFACRYVIEKSKEYKTISRARLHGYSYHDLRGKTDLPSQVILSAIGRVMAYLRYGEKEELENVITFDTTSHRVILNNLQHPLMVSLATVKGRIIVPVTVLETSGDQITKDMKAIRYCLIKWTGVEFLIHLVIGK